MNVALIQDKNGCLSTLLKINTLQFSDVVVVVIAKSLLSKKSNPPSSNF